MSLHPTPLQCTYLSFEQFRQSPEASRRNLLGAVCFSDRSQNEADMRMVRVPMPSLDRHSLPGAQCELWSTGGEAAHGARGALRYAHDGRLLFGAIQLAEDAFTHGDDDKTPLRQASETAYREIFRLIDELDYPHILRFWNYIADINGESHGMERYRQFNIGRQDGFLARGRGVTGPVPAASAVGFEAGPLTIYFLAGRGNAPVPIENPRQVSAYAYPQEYGPRAPTFSRASVCRIGGDDVLFLSGTASIVGHRTLHHGDVVAQTRETVANIEAMIQEANRVAPQAGFTLNDLCYKVYVRRPEDVEAIHGELRRRLGAQARLMFLRADICRRDLLMEIEATAGHPLHLA